MRGNFAASAPQGNIVKYITTAVPVFSIASLILFHYLVEESVSPVLDIIVFCKFYEIILHFKQHPLKVWIK